MTTKLCKPSIGDYASLTDYCEENIRGKSLSEHIELINSIDWGFKDEEEKGEKVIINENIVKAEKEKGEKVIINENIVKAEKEKGEKVTINVNIVKSEKENVDNNSEYAVKIFLEILQIFIMMADLIVI